MKINLKLKYWVFPGFICGVILFAGCTWFTEKSEDTLFELVSPAQSNFLFSNDLTPSQQYNIYTDNNFYAGGGVGLGDINGNGLPDIYLVSNQGSNRLYLNKGDFVFEDITEQSGTGGSKPWSTGVSFVDINGNGLLDIYVTNSGVEEGEGRKNELFINNGDLTFTERAEEFGIADSGYSIHAAFFDYDNDGDLDMYLVNNHAAQPIGSYDLAAVDREETDFHSGDRFYRNEGGFFTDITEKAGIYSSGVSFGFGASVGDLNRNGYMDIYISNDFFERDYLYLNNGDGTFREMLEETLSSISTTSMGGDIADLDNDGLPEIFITDMLPERPERIKTITDFIDWEQYREEVELGYHRKFTRNTLQYNHGENIFSEVGRYAKVEASDWSWGALMADFNSDGLRDIFVPNGFYKDVTDKDFLMNINQQEIMRPDGQIDFEKLVELTPSTPTPNYMFENLGKMRFASSAADWGLDQPGFSHGAAYGDLNGNGALDLVVNNVNMESFVYRNRTPELYPERNWIQIQLEGEPPNTVGVGAQVELVSGGRYWYAEQMPQRGFQSSVDPVMHVGLGDAVSAVDSIEVRWPDGRLSLLTDIEARQRIRIRQHDATVQTKKIQRPAVQRSSGEEPLLREITDQMGVDWRHTESEFNDFSWYPLLFHMRSTEGPPLCSGDVTGNGREDFYVGGGRGQPGSLFLQGNQGEFTLSSQPVLESGRESEDSDCIFFDSNADGRSELYVASGSSEFMAGNPALADRLYRWGDDGILELVPDALPRPSGGHMPTGVVRAADVNGDGHIDLFIGVRMTPFGFGAAGGYGTPVGGYLLMNDGNGRFMDATGELAPVLVAGEFAAAGITAAEWGDINGNGLPDLVVAGEWMPITVFLNSGGRLERSDPEVTGLYHTKGWWQSLALADLNGNGKLDLVGGNHGVNSRFRTSREEPLQMWAGDFNRNGRLEHLFAYYHEGEARPMATLPNLIVQLPHLRTRIPSFANFADMRFTDIFPDQELENAFYYRADLLESVIGWNQGNGSFGIEMLPFQAQWSPLYSILPADLDGNGTQELLLGGNLNAVQPQAGPYDATFGLVLSQDSENGFQPLSSGVSGFFSKGEIRSIHPVKAGDATIIIVARNNRELQFFELTNPRRI